MDAEGDNAVLSEGEIAAEESDGEPQAKKPKLERSPEVVAGNGGKAKAPSKKQLKKMMKNREREKKLHQQVEDKMAANMTSQASDSAHLNSRQAEVIENLVRIASGEMHNKASLQKLKTLQFQGVISHLVTGSPSLEGTFHSNGAGDLCRNYRVVVVWLSMVSGDFFRNDSRQFAKVKKLSPCVMFDIEHPGSTRFVKLGLESFMMLPSGEDGTLGSAPMAEPPKVDIRPRWAYLLTMNELSDNDFPNPSRQNGVDQLGRDIAAYFSITEWPECEVCDTPEVSAAKEGGAEGMPMFAVDCEMVGTRVGSELARISIINESLECIYDTHVKPEHPVLDYRTKYSGLSEETLEGVTTTLKDVQSALPSLLPPNSILIGHSLENDFHAMKFRHPFVIDTSWIFTPLATPMGKPGLRKLCKELLSMDIQNSEGGHDSIEDASSCMKLVHLKLKKGHSCKIAFNEVSPSIFTEYRIRGCTTGIVDKESVTRLFGKRSHYPAEVKTDEEAVSRSAGIVAQSKFTFIQFHAMENLLKSPDGRDKEKIVAAAEQMDSNVCQVLEGCPPKTLVFVVCGSSDIRKVRKIQQDDMPNMQLLKKEVMLARGGCVVGVVVN